MKACFQSANILIPNHTIDINKWSVVACDQYTSQPDYWKEVESYVGDEPSTLNLIYPEVYLNQPDKPERITCIQKNMLDYSDNRIIEEKIKDGFVLIERKLKEGTRLGLIGVIDLEAYDYVPGNNALIRATEGTITSRIPPRLKIRKNALLECSHIMVLIDDKKQQLIEPLSQHKDQFEMLYDSNLMQGGGHIRGYGIVGEDAKKINEKLVSMEQASNGFFLAVGDGNHSLATAKAYWEELKENLSPQERKTHPARYALVELVNLYSPALVFEPIHRILFNTDYGNLYDSFITYLNNHHIAYETGNDIIFKSKHQQHGLKLLNKDGHIPLYYLQNFLDDYLDKHPESSIDYIHGRFALEELIQRENSCGILLDTIDKESLFPAIKAGGVLPRKTFSMGEANEKRYYVECRKIK